MEIKDFIKEALVSIKEGISMANKTHKCFSTFGGNTTEYNEAGNYVHFDIAIVVSETGSSKAGGKLKILGGIIGGGANAETEKQKQKELTHRIQFKIFMKEISK